MTTGIYYTDTRHPGLERDYARAPRPAPRPLRMRIVTADRVRFVAYDAHALLESTDPSQLARPGHPLG